MINFFKSNKQLKSLSEEKSVSFKTERDKLEEYKTLYYEFKNRVVRMKHSDLHYLDHTSTFIKESSHSFKHISFINNSINNLIYKFLDSIFKEQSFYNLLGSNYGQNKPEELYKKIHVSLLKKVQEHIDIIVQSRLKYFTGGIPFYTDYSSFKNIDEFNYFVLNNILKEIKLDEFSIGFHLKNDYESILQEYFKQSVIFIRENKETYNHVIVKNEVNRLKNEILKNKFCFLQTHVDDLENVISDLNHIVINEEVVNVEVVNEEVVKEEVINEEIINEKETVKKLTNDQNQQLFNFFKTWFRVSTQEDIQNLINLNLDSIRGDLKLIKSAKSFSLLLFKLSEKGYYTRNQINSIFDSRNITPTKGLKFDKNVYAKYYSNFDKGKTIDCDREIKNINSLLKSL